MKHLHIGALVFPLIDQADFTGPFEVLSRIPESTFHVIGKDRSPVQDMRGLILTPGTTFSEVPPLDLLVVPGGAGQEDLMEDEPLLSFIRQQAGNASYTFSVCTGALLCGAAGLLRGVRATTHWSALGLLPYFGAIPVNARVVIDGKHVSAAGVTAGLDGALRIASLLRDEAVAQQIQLSIEYSPEPPFRSGTPQTAPSEIVDSVRLSYQKIADSRLATETHCGPAGGEPAVERLGLWGIALQAPGLARVPYLSWSSKSGKRQALPHAEPGRARLQPCRLVFTPDFPERASAREDRVISQSLPFVLS